jgi:hypothetical protein
MGQTRQAKIGGEKPLSTTEILGQCFTNARLSLKVRPPSRGLVVIVSYHTRVHRSHLKLWRF